MKLEYLGRNNMGKKELMSLLEEVRDALNFVGKQDNYIDYEYVSKIKKRVAMLYVQVSDRQE